MRRIIDDIASMHDFSTARKENERRHVERTSTRENTKDMMHRGVTDEDVEMKQKKQKIAEENNANIPTTSSSIPENIQNEGNLDIRNARMREMFLQGQALANGEYTQIDEPNRSTNADINCENDIPTSTTLPFESERMEVEPQMPTTKVTDKPQNVLRNQRSIMIAEWWNNMRKRTVLPVGNEGTTMNQETPPTTSQYPPPFSPDYQPNQPTFSPDTMASDRNCSPETESYEPNISPKTKNDDSVGSHTLPTFGINHEQVAKEVREQLAIANVDIDSLTDAQIGEFIIVYMQIYEGQRFQENQPLPENSDDDVEFVDAYQL